MKESYCNIDGIKTRIHEWENRENPTIVCLHGLGSTSLSFIELAEMLRNTYHLLSIDLPGHGGTSPLLHLKDYGPATMNRFINQVVSRVTDQTFFLLAQSFGADIALHYLAAYPKNVKKTLLLDGGYYVRKDSYAYEVANEGAIDSLQKEIDYYIIDFDEYKVDSMEAHLKREKSNYNRWSSLLEAAGRDLVREELGKFKWHANGFISTGAILSMYDYPTTLIYDSLPKTILLLQSTLPDSMGKKREMLGDLFARGTHVKIKKVKETGHLIHWDQPNEVIHELLNSFE